MAEEYIEREAAKRELLSWAVCMNHPEYLIKDDALHVIDSTPAADVAPVRHGRWIMGTDENGLQIGHRECSRCGEIVKYGYSLYGVHNFCNYCGAKMDGDDVNG